MKRKMVNMTADSPTVDPLERLQVKVPRAAARKAANGSNDEGS